MRTCNDDYRSVEILDRRGTAANSGRMTAAALLCLIGAAAHSQIPDSEELRMEGEMAHYGLCASYGCNNGSGGGGSRIGYDPCYLAQNAMRPCASDLQRQYKPVGVDPNLVGTWELPFKGGPWVLEISHDGTYRFHSEAGDGAPTQTGTFSASSGQWSLTAAATGYKDGGNYVFQAPDIWIMTGKLGAAAWRHPASVKSALRVCTSGRQQPPAKATGVDPNLVGTWELPLKGGRWVWEISNDGTYKFHSEAGDGAPAHTGRFSDSNGHWSLAATTGLTGYTDTGLYLYQAPDILIATGRLGPGAWRRPSSSAAGCKKAS